MILQINLSKEINLPIANFTEKAKEIIDNYGIYCDDNDLEQHEEFRVANFESWAKPRYGDIESNKDLQVCIDLINMAKNKILDYRMLSLDVDINFLTNAELTK